MLARPYHRSDAKRLDELLHGNAGDVRLEHDRIFCIGDVGDPFGCLVYRPAVFVHEFVLSPSPLRRLFADALLNYAISDGLSRPHDLHDAVFLVDSANLDMVRYVEGLQAHQEAAGKRLYRLPVRGIQHP